MKITSQENIPLAADSIKPIPKKKRGRKKMDERKSFKDPSYHLYILRSLNFRFDISWYHFF